MRLTVLALTLACSGWAQTDARWSVLHETLQSAHAQASAQNRGGGPKLTFAKHQLRDWIESQLTAVEKQGDEAKASDRINKELEKIGIEPVRLKWESGLLLVITGIGIICQQDESAYGYRRIGAQWRRVWESEQNDYEKYTPQYINAVHMWQSEPTGPTYILTLGNAFGCASAWHSVYYRIWRVDSSESKLLLDQFGNGFLRGPTWIVGSIVNSPMHFTGPVDATIEFTQRSVDAGVHNREAVRHFLIDGDRVHRVAPVALSPRDFVDEWMTQSWSESEEWSSSPDLPNWHQKLHADFVAGTFLWPTMHCQTPDLWQVGFEPHDPKRNFQPEADVYFLVRWTPPYRFALASISDKPSPQCTQEDPEADKWRTLFSTQEWVW